MNNKFKLVFGFAVIVLIILLHIEFLVNTRDVAPETVLVHVKTPNGTPDVNAVCKADVISEKKTNEDIPLERLNSLYDYVWGEYWDVPEDKGFYKLETGLPKNVKDYEIKIVCSGNNYKTIGYTIINKTNMPCEVMDNGFLIC